MTAAPKILLADDDPDMLAVMALHLRNEEYDVVCAGDGIKALTAAQRENPDVLLINVGMTVDDHASLHDEVLDHPSLTHIPIIYIVGPRAMRFGDMPRLPAQSMIYKPVPTSELFAKIERALAGIATGRPGRDVEPDEELTPPDPGYEAYQAYHDYDARDDDERAA